MPREPREFELGGIYHIVKRGIDRRKTFLKKQDFSRFILGLEFCNSTDPADLWRMLARFKGKLTPIEITKRLEEKRKKPRSRIADLLAFTLMPNHIHLIVKEIIEGGISLLMQKIGGYSTYFNHQYDRKGPLFQSRFKAVRVKNDAQLNNVFVYVHTNQIELWEPAWKEFKVEDFASAVSKLREYENSSYNDYTGHPKFPHAIQPDFFLDFYGGEKQCQKVIENWIKFKARKAQFGPEIIE